MVVQGLILAAGEGSRLRPLTFTVPKPLISVMGKSLVERVVEVLRDCGVSDIALVVGYLGRLFVDVLGDGSRFGVRLSYILQERRLGIAHAIYRGVEEGFLRGPFIVHLGDNYFGEPIQEFVREFAESDYDVFIVLTKARDPRRFGYVVLRDGRVWRLIEKPREPPPGGYTLSGLYMFRDPELVGRAFSDLKPSARGEYEITDLIQWFIDRGYNIGYSMTGSWWKDMGTPEDLLELLNLMLEGAQARVEGEVLGTINGKVIVEKGAIVEGVVHGPAYVGRNAHIAKSSEIEHYVSVEEQAYIEGGSISRSLILEEAKLVLGRARIVDSIIGPRSVVVLRDGKYRLIVGERNQLEGL
ncbi:MAG: glucose-1-phosphate thymidylyltransferase [Thermoprotei archaeon]|nr:glucose-1-phosphate thymidylyltransferase [Thermoprotei archaeon]